MRQPAVSVCAERQTKAGTQPQPRTPAPVGAISQPVAPTAPVGHSGIQPPPAGVPQPTALGTITLSLNATPALVRALLRLLDEAVDAPPASAVNPMNGVMNASGSEVPEEPTSLVSALSPDAETLLSVLVSERKQWEQRRVPEDAWLTKTPLLQKSRMDRHRKDALNLIDELMAAGFVEARDRGERGKWRQYRATLSGMHRIEQVRR